MVFINGLEHHRQYYGPVDNRKPIQEWLDKILLTDISPYTQGAFEEYKESKHFFGYGFYCGDESSSEFGNILTALKLVNNLKIFFSSEKTHCEQFGVKTGQLVYIQKSKKRSLLKKLGDVDELVHDLKFVRFDFLGKFSVDIVGELIGDKIPPLVYFAREKNREHMKVLEEVY